jgi:translation initiation factor 5B
MIRQPIISVLGHVDHGKTSFLDKVRESSVAAREAGGITQHIGATEVPIEVVKKICGKMLAAMKTDVKIPGLLFIDTPGHEAFTNLRKRGGSIADLAVLVVDIREGFMPQTIEAIEILKNYKTPFIIVANKVDLMMGWQKQDGYSFMRSFKDQSDDMKKRIDIKIYEIIGRLSEMNIQSERFDRVEDFTKQVSIVPASAKTGEGVAEALMLLAGMSQKYLEKNLQIEVSGPGKASILEVKEERGFGTSLDLVLYNGTIHKNDRVILSGKNGPIETKVKALLKPKPLDEMRDPKDKFDNINSVSAASGLKLIGPGIEEALPGGQVYVVDNNAEELKAKITEELDSVKFDHENEGVIVRADTLGSLEAILGMLKNLGIPVRKSDIGAVTKTDLMEAESIKKKNPEYGMVMAFNAPVSDEIALFAKNSHITILSDKVIYRIIENYEEWMKEVKKQQEMSIFDTLPFPAELKFMEGCTFKRSNPAVIGIAVIKGRIRPGYPLMKEDGTHVGTIESLQEKNEKLEEAKKGDEIAVAIDGPLVGRHIEEGDILFTEINFNQYEQILKTGMKFLNGEDKELLKKITQIVKKA